MLHDLELAAHGVRLIPLSPSHAEALQPLTDDAMWAGMTAPRPESVDAYRDHIEAQIAAPGMVAFTVIVEAEGAGEGTVAGSTTLYDLALAQRRVEIGSTWYGRDWWGGRVNPAAKLLLFTHAFETLGLQRVALRCDARNLRSAAAIRKLGATPEGVLRSHRVAADGSSGDTAYFSVIESEWPAVREGLRARLN